MADTNKLADAPPRERGAGSKAAAAMVALGILLSRIAGLIRDRIFAHFFGQLDAADAFRAAFQISKIREIMHAVSIPVMAKARIGHFMEARILEALGVDYVDESEVLTPADEEHHIDKRAYKVPFVCGARNLGEALRRIAEGAAMIRTKGEAGSGNIVEAVRHMRTISEGDEAAHGSGQGRIGCGVQETAGAARTGGVRGADMVSCRCPISPRVVSRRRPTLRW